MANLIKTALRNTVNQVRKKLSADYISDCSKKICEHLSELDQYRSAKYLGLYQATRGEVDLSYLWDRAPFQGKFCYFPSITTESSLLFLPATPATAFKKNTFDIIEPDVSPELAIDVEQLQIIIMPLVAFDGQCRRLGMGGGYYDKTLANKKTQCLVGLAYNFQKTSYIEANSWDIPLDMVITPDKIYRP